MLISYPGELFMRMMKMMMIPLVISSMIAGTSSLNAKANGRIALRTLIYFASTKFLNVAFGIFLAVTFRPGNAVSRESVGNSGSGSAGLMDSILDLGRYI